MVLEAGHLWDCDNIYPCRRGEVQGVSLYACQKLSSILELVQLPCNFFIMGLAGGALVNIVPTKTCVPHKECLITLQHPRSSIWNPRWRYRSSVSNSVLLVNGPKNWWWTHKGIINFWIITLLFSFTKIISPDKRLWFC